MTTSLTLAAVAPTVCTGPLPASTPLWALWPECQLRPFRAWRASGSLPPFAFLAELGASANAASAIEPPPADLQGRGGVGNLVAEPEGHAREFKEGSGAADRVSRAFAREVGPRLQEAHAQQGWPCPSGAGAPPHAWPCACGRPPGICEGGSAFHGMPLSRSGGIADPAVFCSPLRLASRRRAAQAPSAGSRRFPRLGQCPAGGHAALQDGVGGRATVMDSQFFPIYYRTSGSPVRKLPSDARYPAFRADSGDYPTLEGEFGTLVVRYGNISKIFFDSITVSEETGRCGRASSRDRRLARRRGARDARRSVADPGNRRSTLLPRALRRAGAPCLPSSRGNAAIERQARGACPAKKPNPIINRRFPRR